MHPANEICYEHAVRRAAILMLSGVIACVPDGRDPDPRPDAGAADLGFDDVGNGDVGAGDVGTGDSGLSGRQVVAVDLQVAASVDEGQTTALRATARLDDSTELDVSDAARFDVSAPTIARVDGTLLFGLAPGATEVTAEYEGVTSAAASVEVQPVGELRGVWVTRWSFSNASDIQAIVDDAASANLNAIFFQVRGEADAFYQSAYEPWSRVLTGTLGQDPGWDPLAEMLTRAQAAGIQVHAWLNTFAAWQPTTPPTSSQPPHVLTAHPDWLCADENGVPMAPGDASYQFLSPGNPAVRDHIADVVEDLVSNYAVDGVHFDYVRYPGPNYCHDAASEAAYAEARLAEPQLSYADFQRRAIGALLENARQKALAARPGVVLTAATWGIYKNVWNWSSVSKGFDDYYQDAHAYVAEGSLDALVPMTYWAIAPNPGERLDFVTLTEAHVSAAAGAGRYSYAGIEAGHGADEVLDQVEAARLAGARGVVFFEMGQLRSEGHLARLRAGPFSEPAAVPPYAFR